MELILVIGVLATLCALIFVAVQKVRSGATQTQCTNNLKQIALAANHYRDVNERLPPGYCEQTKAGVLVYLLPYLDQGSVSAALPQPLLKGSGGLWYTQLPNNGLAPGSPVSTRIGTFECPAAGLYSTSYSNGTVQTQTLGGGGGTFQLTLKEMLAHADPAIRSHGQAIAKNLDRIFYAAWCVQHVVFELTNFDGTVGKIKLTLDGGSVTVTGGSSGVPLWGGYSDGAFFTAAGSFTAGGQTYNINLNEPNLLLTWDAARSKEFKDMSSTVDSGNLLDSGYSYDPASPLGPPTDPLIFLIWQLGQILAAFLGVPGPTPFTEQENTLIAANVTPADFEFTARTLDANLGKLPTTLPQDNKVFWGYYERIYGLNHKYTVGGTPPGFALNPNNPVDGTMGRTNYVGNSGMYGFNAGTSYSAGPYFPDSAVAPNDIIDGESNTIAFGESLGGSELSNRNYALTWMAVGVMPSYWDCQTPATWFTFGSGHPTSVNFAFCDGSVRAIKKVTASPEDSTGTPPARRHTPRWAVFQQLAGMQDRAVPDLSVLD